ncbi:hypothetical protein KGF57_004619 [Candida theae]|uniref:RRM domain-containing protein n=1 Tax=Candida theae TaxID=1198502 RepID=A0AAD5BBH1_9ASCO|nr:uncharacterized protein KGF57_004619 [Candida theae]KAI5949796.1 hypothetical protein KGF57_004619 [Candida theae]
MPSIPINSSILFVGQVPREWDEETVKSVVCGSGKIVDVRLGSDGDGKNKGYCFVEYQSTQEARNAAPLLGSISIYDNGKIRHLKIEGSKEAFKGSGVSPEPRRILALRRNKLPRNVQLPSAMTGGGSPFMGRANSPIPNQGMPVPTASSFNPNIPVNGPTETVPMKFTQATKTFPYAPTLPFATPDNINATLSKIQPAQLVETLAAMKNLLQADPSKAQNLSQMDPDFAVCAAQVLLLMGFVDNEVLTSMSTPSASSTPQPSSQPLYSQPQTQLGIPTNGNSPYMAQSQMTGGAAAAAAAAAAAWPKLPIETQNALRNMDAETAKKALEFINMSEEYFRSLSYHEKTQINQFRQSLGVHTYPV